LISSNFAESPDWGNKERLGGGTSRDWEGKETTFPYQPSQKMDLDFFPPSSTFTRWSERGAKEKIRALARERFSQVAWVRRRLVDGEFRETHDWSPR